MKVTEVKKVKNLIFIQSSASSSYSWWVPLTFSYPGNGFDKTYSKDWLKEGEKSRIVSGLPESLTPVIFNVQQTGYYRFVFPLNTMTSIVCYVVRFCSESIMTRRTGSSSDSSF